MFLRAINSPRCLCYSCRCCCCFRPPPPTISHFLLPLSPPFPSFPSIPSYSLFLPSRVLSPFISYRLIVILSRHRPILCTHSIPSSIPFCHHLVPPPLLTVLLQHITPPFPLILYPSFIHISSLFFYINFPSFTLLHFIIFFFPLFFSFHLPFLHNFLLCFYFLHFFLNFQTSFFLLHLCSSLKQPYLSYLPSSLFILCTFNLPLLPLSIHSSVPLFHPSLYPLLHPSL